MSELRAPRRDKGQLQITNRDALVLRWIAEQYTTSFDHLQLLLGRYAKATTKDPDKLSISATRDTIQRWLQLELIEQPRKLLAEHPPYIWLSRHGLTQFGLPYSYYHPKISTIHHLYTSNALRLLLENSGLRWTSQRTLTRATNERPLPDAELRDIDKCIAINIIERSHLLTITLQEEQTTLQALLNRTQPQSTKKAKPYYTQIWYFLHDDIRPSFEQSIKQLAPALQQRVILNTLDTHDKHPEVTAFGPQSPP